MDTADASEGRREALIQAGLILASELSLPTVLQKIVDLASQVADARYGALGVLDDEGTGLSDFVTYGVTDEERRAIGDLPHGKGILGVLIEEARSLRLRRIQDDPRSVGFPPNHPPMTTFLGVPVKIQDRVFGNLYLTEKRGGQEFTDDDRQAVEVLATQAAVAIENARLYEEAGNRERRLEATAEVTRATLEGRDTEAVLELVASHARELVGADLATVSTPEPEGPGLVVRVASGLRAEEVRGMSFSTDGSISGDVMRTGRPLMVPDASDDPRSNQPVVRAGGIGPALLVPLRVEDRPFGTLLVANRRGGRQFSGRDLEIVDQFAGQASVALEYARVHGELQRLAVLEDRERIAQDLHDGVIQSLFAVGMSLQAAEAIAHDPDALGARLESAVEGIDRAIRDLRNYIFALRPGAMADRQLDRALRDLVSGFSEATEVAIVPEIDPEVAAQLSGRTSDLLQAAREALSNAIRHSGGETVAVRLRAVPEGAVLEVEDDGRGFDPARQAGSGQGLGNLRARAEAMAGRLEIEPGHPGTVVRIVFPL